MEGNDDQITLSIEDVKENHIPRVTLKRDQIAEIFVNGKGFRVNYPSVYVAPDQPETSPSAFVIVTRAESKALGPVIESAR